MKFLILVSSILALATASWEPIHEKYNGPFHYPMIHKGVPVEPVAVQRAREAHLIAFSQAKHKANNRYDGPHKSEYKRWEGPIHYPVIYKGVPVEPVAVQLGNYENNQHGYVYENRKIHKEGRKWDGPLHYPKIYKGVPLEPVEVQKARAAHLTAFSEIKYNGRKDGYSRKDEGYGNLYETSKIGYDGKPVDTQEVEVAKLKYFADVVHKALVRKSQEIPLIYRKRGGDNDLRYHGQADGDTFELKHSLVYGHHAGDHHDSKSRRYSHQQIHAPVYGQHHDNEQMSNRYIYSYGQIHAPRYNYHDDQQYQVGVNRHYRVPVDTIEVQEAKAAHLAAHTAAKIKHY